MNLRGYLQAPPAIKMQTHLNQALQKLFAP